MAAQKHAWLKKFTRPTRPVRRAKLAAEALEDRAVPALFTVTTVADGGAGSFRQAIIDANNSAGADVIRFDPGAAGTHFLTADMEQITEDVTIVRGANTPFVTIDGSGQWQLLNANNANVTVNNITFTRGLADGNDVDNGNGGAISVANGNLLLKNSFVSTSDAVGNGGGVSVVNGNLTLFNTDLVDNSALLNGGGAYVSSTAGVVNITDATIGAGVTDTTSTDGNEAGFNGGGLYVSGADVTIKNGRFDSNVAGAATTAVSAAGGAIYVEFGSLTVTKNTAGAASSLVQNKAVNGGAIGSDVADVTITGDTTIGGSEADANTATGSGGGIHAASFGTVLVNGKSDVDWNEATGTGTASGGGGIYGGFGVDITVSGSASVDDNHAIQSGGGIFANGGSVVIKGGASVNRNSATSSSVTFTPTSGATVTNIVGGGRGGGIAARATQFTTSGIVTAVIGGDITVSGGAKVDNNTAFGNGGGLFSFGGDITVDDASVSGNTAVDGNGGGIDAAAAAVFTSSGSLTGYEGGDVSLTNGATVNDNTAGGLGGGIHVLGGRVDVWYSQVDDNQAGLSSAGNGGGIAAEAITNSSSSVFGGTVHVHGGSVSGNRAGGNGGGIYAFGGNVLVHEGAIIDGSVGSGGGATQTNAGLAGGGIYAEAATFTTNFTTGTTGGGMTTITNTFVLGGGNVTVSGYAKVVTNGAIGNGGGIWASEGVIVIDAQVTGNSSEGNGGGIYSGGTVTIDDTARELPVDFVTMVSDNSSFFEGGGVYSKGDVEVTNALVNGNDAFFGHGGGIWADTGATVSVEATAAGDPDGRIRQAGVSENTSGFRGGAIYAETIDLDYVTIDHNRADDDGGGLYGDNIDVFASTISRNIANDDNGVSGDGGGVYVGGVLGVGTATIANSTVSSNQAYDGAGVYVATGYSLFLASDTIVLNAATAGGATGGGLASEDNFAIVTNNSIIAGNTRAGAASDISNNAIDLQANRSNNNLVGNAATAGGLLNDFDGNTSTGNNNIVGVNGAGTRPIGTIIETTGGPNNNGLQANGGPTLTHALVNGSVAKNNGDLTKNISDRLVPPTFLNVGPFDQRGPGFARVQDGVVDIGALEGSQRATVASVVSANGLVYVYDKNGDVLYTINPTDFGVGGGDFRVAAGDLNEDGNLDVVVGSGVGGGQIAAFNGDDGSLLWGPVSPYGGGYKQGVNVGTGGDVDGNGQNDVVVGPGSSGQTVRILSGDTGNAIAGANSFTPLGGVYPSGVRVTLGDANNDGDAEVYVVPNKGVQARVEVWNRTANFVRLRQFNSFNTSGGTISAQDLNGDGLAEVVIGSSSGNSRVQIFQGKNIYDPGLPNPISRNPQTGKTSLGLPAASLFSAAKSQQEARTALLDIDGDGDLDLVVSTGPNIGPLANNVQEIRVFNLTVGLNGVVNAVLIDTITVGDLGLPANYTGGIFVA